MIRPAQIFLLFFLSAIVYQAYGQSERVYPVWDLSKPALFPNGEFWNFCRQHFYYPAEALQKGLGGHTAVSFVVEKDGTLTDVRVLRPIGGGCTEVLRKAVCEAMPCWNPAEANGHPVRQSVMLCFYFHPYTGKVDFLCITSPNLDCLHEEFAALTEKEYYKVNVALRSRYIPDAAIKLRIPAELKSARANVEAVVAYTISASGVLEDARLQHDPGYGCGEAALEYVRAKKYWVPQYYYDTCFAQKKIEIVSFCTDTAALRSSEKIFTETELHPDDLENQHLYREYLRDTLTKSGWIKVDYVVEKDGHVSTVQFGPTSDSRSLAAARKIMSQQSQTKTYTFCGLSRSVRALFIFLHRRQKQKNAERFAGGGKDTSR